MKMKKWLFKWLTGMSVEEFKSTANQSGYAMKDSDELNENYLFDFNSLSGQYTHISPPPNINGIYFNSDTSIVMEGENISDVQQQGIDLVNSVLEKKKTLPAKIKVKPIDVLKELETMPTPFSLFALDEKILMLEEKAKLINQHYTKREVNALIERLENRKKYIEHKIFFDCFQNTTQEKINIILQKYDLVMKSSDIFVPEFPDEAIKVMKEYTEKVLLITNKKPIFSVIATSDNFKEVDKKRDPILLVQSPFGFFFQILGVWAEEMLLLSEL